jgi:ssDNA-specific exonuclease RecJ
MFKGIDKKELIRNLKSIEDNTKKAFSNVKKEFEEHLEAINENTNEIQSNYELLLQLETKIDKIENSLSEINRFIIQFKNQNVYFLDEKEDLTFTILPLTNEEKEVFKVLYEFEEGDVKATYHSISDYLGISTSLIREYIASLIEKGVPIIKNYLNQKIYLTFEPKFKEIQIKKNIVNL